VGDRVALGGEERQEARVEERERRVARLQPERLWRETVQQLNALKRKRTASF